MPASHSRLFKTFAAFVPLLRAASEQSINDGFSTLDLERAAATSIIKEPVPLSGLHKDLAASDDLEEIRLDDTLQLQDLLREHVGDAAKSAIFDGDFEGWLAQIKLIVPNDLLPSGTTGGLTYTLKNLVCVNVQIGTTKGIRPRVRKTGGLKSSLGNNGVLSIQAQEVQVKCSLRLEYHHWVLGSNYADVEVASDGGTSVSLKAALTSSDAVEPKIPDKLTIRDCSFKTDFKLKIPSGSIWTKIVEHIPGVNGQVQKRLNDAMQQQVCSNLLVQASSTATKYLKKMHDFGHSQMHIPRPNVSFEWNENYVDWKEVPLVKWLENLQTILPKATGQFHQIVHNLFPDQRLCLVESKADFDSKTNKDVCIKQQRICIIGEKSKDGSKCLSQTKIHDKPPAVFAVDIMSASLKFSDPNGTILKGNQSMLTSSLSDVKTHLSVKANVSFVGTAGSAKIDNLWGVTTFDLDVDKLKLGSHVLAVMDKETFDLVPQERYVTPQCLEPALKMLKIANITSQFDLLLPKLTWTQQKELVSPLLAEGITLVEHFLGGVWRYQGAVAPVLRGLLQNNTESMIEKWTEHLQKETCPAPKGQETPGGKPPLVNPQLGEIFNICAASVAFIAMVLITVLYVRHRHGHSDRCACWFSDSLCMSEHVPIWVSCGVPVCIGAAIFLLLGSNFLYMAFSLVNLELGKDPITGAKRVGSSIYEIMPYSLLYSIHELRTDADMPMLADVLTVFSGVLPYSKLILMLLMWILPARLINARWRGRVLMIVDQIGKYSLVDIFVIQFINGSLFAEIAFPFSTQDVSPTLGIAIRTREESGFFAFVSATVASLIIGHICLHYHIHHPEVQAEDKKALADSADQSSLREAKLQCSVREVDGKLSGRQRRWVGPALIGLLLLVASSYWMLSVRIQLVAVGQTVSDMPYSMVDFASCMQEFSLDKSFGTIFSQITFILFALSTIVLHIVLLIFIWYGQVSPSLWEKMNTAAHTLAAWSCLDVMVLSMIQTLIEMTASEFVILDKHQLAVVSKVIGSPVTDPNAVVLKVTLEYGTYLMVLAALVHAVLGRFVMSMLERATLLNNTSERSCPRLRAPTLEGAELSNGAVVSPQ